MVFMEHGFEAFLFAHVDTCKMAPSRSFAAGTFIRQFVSSIQHQGSETPYSLDWHRPFLWHTRDFEARLIHTCDIAKSQWPASCFTMRAKLPAWIRESCFLLHPSKAYTYMQLTHARHLTFLAQINKHSLGSVRDICIVRQFSLLFLLFSAPNTPLCTTQIKGSVYSFTGTKCLAKTKVHTKITSFISLLCEWHN